MKLEVSEDENTLVPSLHFLSSTFIDFNDFSDADVSLLVSFDVNVFGSFLASILDVYPIKDVPSNLNQVYLGSKFQNCNRLFESNVCYSTFVKQVEVIGLQQDQSRICFVFAHHV